MTLRTFFSTVCGLSLVVVWTYWSTLLKTAGRWMADVQYSHGWLIPVFSVVLLYLRRDMLQERLLRPSWWFIPFLALALSLRFIEAHYFYNGPDSWSIVPMFMALFLAVGGWHAFRWAWPSCAFLIFMCPLPYFLHIAASTQLQRIATSMSEFVLQTFGLPAVAEGTIIKINEAPISVAEACSGLGMIMTFIALSVAAVLLIKSQWWVKVGLILGAIPLSLVCNTIRISVVGAFKYAGYDYETVNMIHDAMGWVMIVLACGMIFIEIYVLERIVITHDDKRGDDAPLPFPFAVRT